MAATKKKGKMFAWTELRLGGEGKLIDIGGGRAQRYVIHKRNIVAQGSEVSQSDLGVDDETWDRWVEDGVLRSYPLPEGTDEYTSPSQAFLRGVSTGAGEVDIDKLMELGLANPAIAAPEEAEAAAEVPEGA